LRCRIKLFIWDLSVFLTYALKAMNFPLWTAFAVPHRFWQIVYSLPLNYRKFLSSSLISSMTTDHWAMCCSISNCLCIFCCCFCCWILILFHCDQIECRGLFLFAFVCWGLLHAGGHYLKWNKLGNKKQIRIILICGS
jgi:hypothetical protein